MYEARIITETASVSCDVAEGHVLLLTGGGGKLPLYLVDDWRVVTALFTGEREMSKAACVARDMGSGDRVRFHIGNARTYLPGTADSSFDCVAATRLVALFDPGEEELLIAEVYRVLRPGGRFVALQRMKLKSAGRSIVSGFGRGFRQFLWPGSIPDSEGFSAEADYYGKFEEAGFVLEKVTEKTGWCNWIVVTATKPAGLPDGAPQAGG